ncbi:MAG: TIGR03960 family B12-binding radical SAM protein, partial [Deltaproteobacteria bacterium]|nr:TIGR03960 family B12-binding radical SAM protein [Deltaproteobacteria bacterium]
MPAPRSGFARGRQSIGGRRRVDWEEILSSVERPGRYIGGEANSSGRTGKTAGLRVALAFPDTYEVGMSHLGLQILYAVVNSRADAVAERCYAPWPDMEARMRGRGLPLCTLESRSPLGGFDLVGFSLQYELSYTNVLNMLEMGGISLYSRDRTEAEPLVIAGGPCAFNPAPMSPFFDAMVIGEGEEAISEILNDLGRKKAQGPSRRRRLEALAEIPGVYVPAVHTGRERIRKRTVADLDAWDCPLQPVVPLIKTIHDRINLEIARGCTRGCRFCQAGMVWRPVRERNPALLLRMADAMLTSTGYDEMSLLSLSAGDYSRIEPLIAELAGRYYDRRVALALPSLRVETLTKHLIDSIRRVRKTSFTLAPEAGTQRLRDAINKGNTEDDLIATAARVFEAGWKSVKLYFMLGLPGEREEDLEGIVDLGYKAAKEAKGRGQVTLSLSTFVPKPHTPFQWETQIGIEETLTRQSFFKRRVRSRSIGVKWHDARMSLLEGILSRGGEELAPLIEEAFRAGCRFDGWTDRFRFDRWEAAMDRTGIRVADYLRGRDPAESLPWDRIDAGVGRDFLLGERAKSFRGETTEDCRTGACHDCGACRPGGPAMIVAGDSEVPASDRREPGIQDAPVLQRRFRFRFTKEGPARFLSHLEVVAAILRAMNRCRLSFAYSVGFHPHPRISLATATAVGLESLDECGEVWLSAPPEDPLALLNRINACLPEGLEIRDLSETLLSEPSLSDRVRGFEYEAILPEGTS